MHRTTLLLTARRRARTVPAAWFRSNVQPANSDSWAQAELLLVDPLENRRVAELETELSTSGFDRPVIVEQDAWWRPAVRVVDGMHRSIAAMRLGLDIPVRVGYDPAADYDHSDVYRVTAEPPAADLIDAVLSSASFRSSTGHWIQCDTASGRVDGPVSLYLPRHPELRPTIAAELQERLRQAGVFASVEFLESRQNE
ncbi:ParB-like nuclease domain (plasmid) [Tsukamurella tyrosinosolvens]|uniref:ParB-like nuclease domain-containing protein n=1 Tax=Tsukamurella tyrosinosolvens TaxID=57704 RepID=A0A1H4U8N1_TSUTY|nr:ParB N-terminal domain-containing protein [Tsukamurella tyrosinosolvens]SEC65122.1 ParB-like nuclease domain-containing protein [Tsukamurella tyrosinosolvens]VEH94063.1 ParB-like nuclease domain [Tsukamurella tyrosinosolvens]